MSQPPKMEQMRRQMADFAWYRQFLMIEDRARHSLIPFEPRPIQMRVRKAILDQERNNTPARLIVLKARREGVSTIVQATFAHRAFTRRRVRAYTIAHELETAAILHGMTETMWQNLPQNLKPGPAAGRSQGRRLRLDNDSDLRTETAKDAQAGRGGSATLLHCSELAFWDRPEQTLLAMQQTVPHEPGTIVVIESTANGVGNAFYSEWMRAKRGDSGYMPLFFSWLDDSDYQIPVGARIEPEDLDEDELGLVALHSASEAQIRWRRMKINMDMQGDLEKFHQEYPTTPEEAFITSGRQFFGAKAISRFSPDEPIARVELDGVWKKGAQLGMREDKKGPLWVYQWPNRDGRRYLIFVDPAGIISDREYSGFSSAYRHDSEDYTCMWVLDCSTMQTVAVWHAKIDLGLSGIEAAKLGKLYGNAVICIETTGGYGFVLVEKLREVGYSALHRDRQRETYTRDRKARYGWNTTETSRPLMLETLRDVLRETPWLLHHAPLKDEMQNFIVVNRRPEAAPGQHDDMVMACAGAYEVAREYASRPVIVTNRSGKRRQRVFQDVLSRATK